MIMDNIDREKLYKKIYEVKKKSLGCWLRLDDYFRNKLFLFDFYHLLKENSEIDNEELLKTIEDVKKISSIILDMKDEKIIKKLNQNIPPIEWTSLNADYIKRTFLK